MRMLQPPTAIFAVNDNTANGALSGLMRMGLRCRAMCLWWAIIMSHLFTPLTTVERSRINDFRGGCSRSGGRRRSAFHNGAGGRESRGECRFALPILSKQGFDLVPPTERRVEADYGAVAHNSWRKDTPAPRPPPAPRRHLHQVGVRRSIAAHCTRRRGSTLSGCPRGTGDPRRRRSYSRSIYARGTAGCF